MSFQKRVEERLSKLILGKELYDEGIFSMTSIQRRHMEMEIEVLTRLLEEEGQQ